MKPCRKRQVERRGDEVLHRCVNKKADQYRQPVEASACDSCPVRAFIEQKQKKTKNDLPVIQMGPLPPCEFRVNGSICGVTNLTISEDICNRCVKDSKDATATFGEKVMNYFSAVRKWTAAGRPERTDEEVQTILESFCNRCNMFDKERQVCNSCGCPANNSQPAIRNKLRMATEACPLGQFPAKVKTDA